MKLITIFLANWRFRGAVHISMVNGAFIILSGFRYIENVELFIASLQLKDLINFETSVSGSIPRKRCIRKVHRDNEHIFQRYTIKFM